MLSSDGRSPSRREFLGQTLRAGLPLLAGSVVAAAEIDPRPVVVKATSDRSVDSLIGHPSLLRELIGDALVRLTGTDTAADAWNHLLAPDEVIGIKFNQSGAYPFQTTAPMARALTESLTMAGFKPEQIVLIEVPSKLARSLKTRPPEIGWSDTTTDFGSGQDQLARVLDQVTALINVPFLKTHNIAGMTGCMKNLSHALVRHPARYHANGCLPFITDIVAIPAIRNKIKLNLMNALRAVWEAGPDVQTRYIFEPGTLLLSTDPVATDSVGTDLIDRQRAEQKKPPIGGKEGLLALWRAAESRKLGVADRDRIRRRQVRL